VRSARYLRRVEPIGEIPINMISQKSQWAVGTYMFCLVLQLHAVQVETRTVEVIGTGPTMRDAISDGLIEAIGQVAGRFIEAETELKSLEVSVDSDGEQAYFASDAFQSRVKSATQGAVSEYRILQEGKNDLGLYEVRLSVSCLRVIPSLSNRKRVVCATFAFPGEPRAGIFDLRHRIADARGSTRPARQLAEAFTDNLEAYLVQSRKFMLLDRRGTDAVAQEKNIALEGNVPIETVLRLTTDSTADLVVVGSVEAVDYVVSTNTMRSGREVVVGEGFVEVAFRVIDVFSKQVKYADRKRFVYTDQDLRNLSGSFQVNRAANLMMSDAANRVGYQIIEAIYPLRVVAVSGNRVTLSEGGRGIAEGQVFDVFALGEEMIHPNTGESLGPEEIPAGQIRIVSSNPRTSVGVILSADRPFEEGYICRMAVDQKASAQRGERPPAGNRLSTDELF
jgi:hypothetical protein